MSLYGFRNLPQTRIPAPPPNTRVITLYCSTLGTRHSSSKTDFGHMGIDKHIKIVGNQSAYKQVVQKSNYINISFSLGFRN